MKRKNHKRKSKLMSLALSLIMILSMVPTAYANINDYSSLSVWDGSMSAEFDSGDGSILSPYIIRTPEQFAYFAHLVNDGDDFNDKYVKLEADIKFNDTSNVSNWGYHPESRYTLLPINRLNSIGDKDNPFNGNFDGNGHTIYGACIYSYNNNIGLFGYTESSAVVANLCIRDSYFYGNDYVGSLVGFNNGKVINCVNFATVIGNKNIGGICGYNTGNISKCINNGNINGKENVGGISNVVISENSNAYVNQCFNSGDISAENLAVGGILGIGYVGYGTSLDVYDCYNTGTITAKMDVGGIVGMTYIEQGELKISRVYNVGDIIGESLVGEIIGCKDDRLSKIYPEIKNCYYLDKSSHNGVGHYLEEEPIADIDGEINSLTHEQLTKKDNLIDFDFENVWEIQSVGGYSYPTLQGLNYENAICEIQIVTLPNNLNLKLGDELDLTGLILVAQADNGKEFDVTDYEISGFDSEKPGEQEIVITYGKYSVSFKVYVEKLTVAPLKTTATADVITDSTIILVPIDGCEYKMDDGQWQTSNIFTDLKPNSTHTFYLRFAETDTTYASKENVGVVITTANFCGDVNDDQEVTMLDVVLLQKYIVNLVQFSSEQIRLADVNLDTEISMLDVTTMQKYIAKLIHNF